MNKSGDDLSGDKTLDSGVDSLSFADIKSQLSAPLKMSNQQKQTSSHSPVQKNINDQQRPVSFETIEEFQSSVEGLDTSHKKHAGRNFDLSNLKDGQSLYDPPII